MGKPSISMAFLTTYQLASSDFKDETCRKSQWELVMAAMLPPMRTQENRMNFDAR